MKQNFSVIDSMRRSTFTVQRRFYLVKNVVLKTMIPDNTAFDMIAAPLRCWRL